MERTLSPELKKITDSFVKKTKELMRERCGVMTPKELSAHISKCKEALRDVERIRWEDMKWDDDYNNFIWSKPFDLFLEHCQEVVEYANVDKSNLKLIKGACLLETQLEQAVHVTT